tara:strand:+ start:1997 stop:2893 length:897 start_codon:yes stop_codon:yes gene_type:complete
VFYTANNSKLQVNGNEICATNAQLSLGANLQPSYTIGQRNTTEFSASNGIGGRLSFDYYLTGRDYFKSFITGQGEKKGDTTVISGNFGGLNFDSGYLTSYSVNFSPNSPAVANATVSFFDQLNGIFSPTTEEAPTDKQVLNLKNASLTHYIPIINQTLSGEVSEFLAGSFNYQAEVKPVYLMNETKPSSVSFGPKTINMNFETDNPTGYLPVTGNTARISVDLRNSSETAVENFTCSGVLNQRNLGASVGDYVKQTINVTQATTQATSVYVAEMIDNGGNAGCIGVGTVSSEVGIGTI